MSETYEQIINEIEKMPEGASYPRCTVRKYIERTREAVGGDPSEWWVEDADGNRVHIWDAVMCDGEIRKIALLGAGGDVMDDETSFVQMSNAHKVIPDTREKIIEDAMARFTDIIISQATARGVIEQAVDRAMKLGAVDA